MLHKEDKNGSKKSSANAVSKKNSFRKIDNNLLFQIYDLSPFPIFIIDVINNSEFIFAGSNKIHQQVMKFPINNFAGKSIDDLSEIIPKRIINKFKNRYKKCVKTKKVIEYFETYKLQSDESYWHTFLNPILDKSGNVIRIIGNSHNIYELINTQKEIKNHKENLEIVVEKRTKELDDLNKSLQNEIKKREKTTKLLKNSEALINSILNAVPQKIYWKDTYHRYLGCNKSFANKLGFKKASDVVGLTDYDLFDDELASKHFDIEKKVIKTNKPLLDFEEQIQFNNGKVRCYRRSVLPFVINSKTRGVIGTFEDITLLKEIESELKETNIAKDKFFSIIAHDLRSPLTALLGFSEILKNEYSDMTEEEVDECLSGINNGIKGLQSLILNLLEWARIQTNRIDYNPTDFDVYDTVLEVLLAQSINIKQKEIEIVKRITPKSYVYADEYMIRAVIRNIISNAVKFSNKEGKIIIDSKMNKNHLIFYVEDEGIGISESDRESIFYIDKQLSNKGTEGEDGTGLGLILCKEFISKNNGNIWFESKEGKGTTFYFSIPIKK